VASVRAAVRAVLEGIPPGQLVLVGCSGGADSMALSAATAFEAPRRGLRAGAVIVDHGLQSDSAPVAARTAQALRTFGLDPVEVASVSVPAASGSGGPEAAAREVRYAALRAAAGRHYAAAVLVGHTRDDQAETVLLGLARGSGARSLSGMRADAGWLRRPLLEVNRATTRAACAAERLPVWDDPHNADPAFVRARVRHHVLPVLEAELGPGVAAALARTAGLLAADADTLDDWARDALAEATTELGLSVGVLHRLPSAVRSRVVRRAALAAGCPAGDLSAGHVAAVEALVTSWHGQAGVDLPGGVCAVRRQGDISLRRSPVEG
jgi:tRNA(Ile)-lysidine synthase